MHCNVMQCNETQCKVRVQCWQIWKWPPAEILPPHYFILSIFHCTFSHVTLNSLIPLPYHTIPLPEILAAHYFILSIFHWTFSHIIWNSAIPLPSSDMEIWFIISEKFCTHFILSPRPRPRTFRWSSTAFRGLNQSIKEGVFCEANVWKDDKLKLMQVENHAFGG